MSSAIRTWPATLQLIRETGLRAWLMVGLLIAVCVAWIALIFPQWSENPDLSHGFFTPILFILLLNESRRHGPFRLLPAGTPLWVICGLLVLASLGVLIIASLFASAMAWTHTMVLFLLGGSFTGALLATWLHSASRPVRIVPFNYVAGIAILLWILSLPLPPGTYGSLTLNLQLWVSERVLQALHLLGIPAIQNGNIIELPYTTVGVEEACSGVRSLLSCIYAGFFFSAAFVRHWLSRGLILVLAPLIAIGMNFVRSLTLTLLAHRGVDIEGTWHDATGFAILGITAVILGALALGLERLEPKDLRRPARQDHPKGEWPPADAARMGSRLLATGYAAGLGCILTFTMLTRPATPEDHPLPDLLALMPEKAEGWHVGTTTDLYRFADVLETEHLAQRSYAKTLPDGSPLQITFYLAYWPPGQAGVSVVATHTPDACWPGAGWVPQPVEERLVALELPHRTIDPGQYRIFQYDDRNRNVWFWHSYDRQVIPEFEPRSPLELLGSVLTYGVRSQGEQLFVRMTSNQPWEAFSNEALVQEIFAELQTYGL